MIFSFKKKGDHSIVKDYWNNSLELRTKSSDLILAFCQLSWYVISVVIMISLFWRRELPKESWKIIERHMCILLSINLLVSSQKALKCWIDITFISFQINNGPIITKGKNCWGTIKVRGLLVIASGSSF